MQDFINRFLKAWKAWSDDGKDAFLESFLDEVKSSQNDPSNFLGILEQEIKSLSQEGLKDDISSMLEVIESMKNEISQEQNNPNENVDDFMNALQDEIKEEQSISNDNPNEFVESLAQAITETQENANEHTEEKSFLEMSEDEYYEHMQEQYIQMNEYDGIARVSAELEQQEIEREEAELENKALQDYEESQIQRAEEISITEHENELAREELERYAIEGENKALEQYYESQNPDTLLYEQQVAQEQDKEKQLSNNQDLELETLRDSNIKQGLNNESIELLESLQVIRDETSEVTNSLRANDELLRPTGENTTSKIASIALEENKQLNEKETNEQELAKTQESEQEGPQEKPKITPSNDIDLKDKYANLHSFFKQTELDIKQKRIKTKLDFKESFLNYAKNHMSEDELKVLLVVSQKEPTKLTKEHINLITDCLEQAHGNKHMQDKGLQLSVKSILGHELEKEHQIVLKDYLKKSKDSLEPMDNRVYEVMQKHLDKQQAKTLKNLDSTTQSVGVNVIKEQAKANKNAEQPKNSQSEPTQEANTQDNNLDLQYHQAKEIMEQTEQYFPLDVKPKNEKIPTREQFIEMQESLYERMVEFGNHPSYFKTINEFISKAYIQQKNSTEMQMDFRDLNQKLMGGKYKSWSEHMIDAGRIINAEYARASLEFDKKRQAKQEQSKTLHPDEPWLDYDPKAHKGLQERQKSQEKAQNKGNNNDEPWIEFGKKEQARAKAHYQAMLEKERAKELAKEQNSTQKEVKKEILDYGYTQNTPAKSRKR
uniref:Uncharacterized protein n=1 Tax=Helicobacter cetorum TaxID=138563 RepID=A7LH14_9HELI|nr:conserved hypothetical protein [Helicobacter cetorum]